MVAIVVVSHFSVTVNTVKNESTIMAANGVVVWEWQTEYGNWQPYSPQISTFIESQQATNQSIPLGQVDPNLYLYVVDISNMCQIRQGTGKFVVFQCEISLKGEEKAHDLTGTRTHHLSQIVPVF